MGNVLSNIVKKTTLRNAFAALDVGANIVGQYVVQKSPYGTLYNAAEAVADARTLKGAHLVPVAGRLIPARAVSTSPNAKIATIDLKPDITVGTASQTIDTRDWLTKLIQTIESYFQ